MKRWNKSGQFYLIAAIVIISVIIGLTSISNYSKKKNYEKINDLKDELQIETGQITEYANSHDLTNDQANEILKNISEIYSNSSGIENLFFLYGTKSRVIISAYTKTAPENISIDGNDTLLQPEDESYKSIYYTPLGNETTIKMDNVSYSFSLSPGSNFYFIISKDDYIVSNKE